MEAAYSSSSSTAKQAQLPYNNSSSSLHSIRKASGNKPWRKPAVAPLPPTMPRVYKVDPINFRDLVQKLTSPPEYLSESIPPRANNLQSVAPPPIEIRRGPPHVPSLVSAKVTSPFSAMYKDLADTLGLGSGSTPHHQKKDHNNLMGDSSYLKMNLSPASQHWFSFPMLSPGTLTSLEL